MESGSVPGGQDDGDGVWPPLPEAPDGPDPAPGQVISQVIALYREFPARAVRLPGRGRPWTAVRPAPARAPGAGLPMIWVHAGSAAELAGRMRSADAQLAPP